MSLTIKTFNSEGGFFSNLSLEERLEFLELTILDCKHTKNLEKETTLFALLECMLQKNEISLNYVKITKARLEMYDACRVSFSITNSWNQRNQ